MSATQERMVPATLAREDGFQDAMRRSSALLRKEGFIVSRIEAPARGGAARAPDLLASSGPRLIRVFVLIDGQIDSEETRHRLRASYREGETRVYVRWPLSWRVLSNLTRWGLRGVSVMGW